MSDDKNSASSNAASSQANKGELTVYLPPSWMNKGKLTRKKLRKLKRTYLKVALSEMIENDAGDDSDTSTVVEGAT